jgi:hypothetical protein
MKTEVFGTIEAVNQPREFASGFRVQEVLVRTNEKSAPMPVQFKGDAVDTSLGMEVGEEVRWECWVNSREYNGRHYVELAFKSILSGPDATKGNPMVSAPTNRKIIDSRPVSGRTTSQAYGDTTQPPMFNTTTTTDLPF